MLTDRTEAIQSGRQVDREDCGRAVARLVLEAAPSEPQVTSIDGALGRRIARLASMATAIHLAETTALHCRVADAEEGTP